MIRLRNLCLALLVMCMTLVGAGSAWAEAGDLNRIDVNTSASMEVAPDTAYINFSVDGRGETADAAAAKAAEKMEAVRRALLGFNIISSDVVTTSYNLYPVYEKNKVTAYNANNAVQVKLSDLGKVGAVIDKISSAGVGNISGIAYDISNKAQYQNKLLTQAVENARQQAAVVANAGGRNLGGLLYAFISKFGSTERVRYNVMAKSAGLQADAAPATDIAAQKITLGISMDVSFSLQ